MGARMSDQKASPPWRDYQEQAAALFQKMGFSAEVEEDVAGARARHQIDVVVRPALAGLPLLWIVECKHWKTPVPKAHVLTLLQIAQDVGADRAFLLSEVGFQAGAVAAAVNTNVSLSTIEELEALAANSMADAAIRRALTEIKAIEHDLREALGGQRLQVPPPPLLDRTIDLLGVCLDATLTAMAALAGRYPVGLPTMSHESDSAFTADPSAVADTLAAIVCKLNSAGETLLSDLAGDPQETARASEELIEHVENLLSSCDALLDLSPDPTMAERQVAVVVQAMREVGQQAEAVRVYPLAPVLPAVSALMRELIDGVYLWASNPDPESWPSIRGAALLRCATLRDAIRHTPWTDRR